MGLMATKIALYEWKSLGRTVGYASDAYMGYMFIFYSSDDRVTFLSFSD